MPSAKRLLGIDGGGSKTIARRAQVDADLIVAVPNPVAGAVRLARAVSQGRDI